MSAVHTMSPLWTVPWSSPVTRDGARVLRGLVDSDIRSAVRTLERMVRTEDTKVVTEHEKALLAGIRLRLETMVGELRELVMR